MLKKKKENFLSSTLVCGYSRNQRRYDRATREFEKHFTWFLMTNCEICLNIAQ